MEGAFTLTIEREPDFFALTEMRGTSRTVVAEARGRIVGCASTSRREAWLRGRPGAMGYVGDIKVVPSHRRRGLAQKLLSELANLEQDLTPAPYVGLTAAGNHAADGLVLRFGQDRTLRHLTSFISWQLLSLWPLHVDGAYQIHSAGPQDEKELTDFLDGYYRRYDFAPVFGGGGFRRALERAPGLSIGSYLLARKRGKLVASLAVWNEDCVKHTRVRRLTKPLRWLSRTIQAAGHLLPMPPFPTENELLRYSYLRHQAYADGELGALGALARFAVNQARRQDRHFVMITASESDPIRYALKGIPRTTYRYNMVVGTNSKSYQEQLSRLGKGPFYDDAALA
jgi:L-amino acid N-acyltransferase YncA